MSKKQKKVYTALNYIEHFLNLAFRVTGFISISAFTSFVCIPIGITSFSVGLKIFAIATEIKKYRSIIKTHKKKHDKKVLLGKSKLNSTEVLTSKAIIASMF